MTLSEKVKRYAAETQFNRAGWQASYTAFISLYHADSKTNHTRTHGLPGTALGTGGHCCGPHPAPALARPAHITHIKSGATIKQGHRRV